MPHYGLQILKVSCDLETLVDNVVETPWKYPRVYIYGQYTKQCCPQYLKEENFYRLKNGLVNKISIHTATLTDFLKEHKKNDINKFVLLDHMD
jgi:S-adenosylmethionine:diacylglycerol 3-amino-3-carboxypropyl transferase